VLYGTITIAHSFHTVKTNLSKERTFVPGFFKPTCPESRNVAGYQLTSMLRHPEEKINNDQKEKCVFFML